MRILAIADLHGNGEILGWLTRKTEELAPDALILAGDLLGAPESYATAEVEQTENAQSLAGALRPLECPVLYVMGNDDWIERLTENERFVLLHSTRFDLGDFSFVGYPYTLPFMGGVFEKSEDEIREDMKEIEHLLDPRTVLVTHSPAKGVLDGGHGSVELAFFLQRNPVRAHVHGHSHRNFGREGNHFNVAAANRARAMVIDLNTMKSQIIRA